MRPRTTRPAIRLCYAYPLALIALVWLANPANCQPPLAAPLPTLPQQPVIRDCPPPELQAELLKPLTLIPGRLPEEAGEGPLPVDCSDAIFSGVTDRDRFEVNQMFFWRPSNQLYRPTYFDEMPLERYGQSKCPHLQPVFSGIHFFATFPLLPYKMGYQHPHEHVTDAGFYRPGSPAPCTHERLPWSLQGAILEGAAVAGAAIVIP